jgi:hypothetical protein
MSDWLIYMNFGTVFVVLTAITTQNIWFRILLGVMDASYWVAAVGAMFS